MVAKARFQITAEDKTRAAFDSVSNKINKTKAAIGGIAAALPVAAFVAMEKRVLNFADSLQKINQRTGASVEFLSAMSRAADLSGTSLQSVERAIRGMQKSASDANDGMAATALAFEQLGINVQEFIRLNPDQQFEVMAEALSRVDNESKRTQLAMKTMGRAGTEMLTVMKDGAAGIRAFSKEAQDAGDVISQDLADQAAEANDAIERMTRRVNGLAIRLAGPFANAVIKATDLVEEFAKSFGIVNKSDVEQVGDRIDTLRIRLGALHNELKTAEGGGIKGLFADAPEEIRKNISEVETALAQAITAQNIYISESNKNAAKINELPITLSPVDVLGGTPDKPKKSGRAKAKREERDAVQELINALEKEAATVDLTQSQIKLYEIASAGASLEQLNLAQNLIETTDKIRAQMDAAEASSESWKRHNEEMDRLAETVQNLANPLLEMEDKQREFNELLNTGRINLVEYTVAMTDLQESMKRTGDKGEEAFKELKSAVEGWHREFADAVIDNDRTFSQFVESILKQIAKIALSRATQPIFDAVGDFFGGLFSGRANGGPVTAGVPYVVGEKRPELFVPDRSGTILPDLSKIGGGGNVVNITVNSDGGTERRGQSFEMAKRIESAVKGVILAEKRPGGMLA